MSQNQERQKISREKRKALLKRLKAQIGPHQRTLQVVAGLSWVQFLMRVISFGLIARAFEQLYKQHPVDFLTLSLSLIGLNGFGFIVAMMGRKYQGRVSQYARNRLKEQFFAAFIKNRGQIDAQFSKADVLTVASQGIDSLDTYYGVYLNQSLRAYLNCATVLVLVFLLYPFGGFLFLVCLPLIPVFMILVQKRSKKIMAHYWATYMDVGNLFMDDLNGMNTLYSYGADQTYEGTFVEKAEAFRLSTMELLRFQLQSVGYMDGVMYVGIALSGFFASLAFAQGELSLFALVFFVLIASEFFAPIREAGYGMHLVMMNTRMADRIFSFLDAVEEKQVDSLETSSQKAVPLGSTLVVEELSFAYQADQSVLEQVSFRAEPGQLFAVAGVSGRGKSTLAKLVSRQLPLQSGRIVFGSQPIETLSDSLLAKSVAVLSPDDYLFNDSILANLLMVEGTSPESIEAFLAETGALSFVANLPEGLATKVGENGVLLSPGQRQQVLCVRALLGRFPVYIFDEMTASVDRDNEKQLFDLMHVAAKDSVVIFISHKMQQVLGADQVLFLDQDSYHVGSPQVLLEQVPVFGQLLETQRELEAILNG